MTTTTTSTGDLGTSQEGVYAWAVSELQSIYSDLSSVQSEIKEYQSDYKDNYQVMQDNYLDDVSGASDVLFAKMASDLEALELLDTDFSTLLKAINDIIEVYEQGDKDIETKCSEIHSTVSDALQVVNS